MYDREFESTGAFPGETPTALVVEEAHANAERRMNHVRAVVLALLAVAAIFYASRVPTHLTLVNASVLVPMLLWTLVQQMTVHRRRVMAPWLSSVNALVDISAVTLLLAGYGLVGMPDLAVKSPIWAAYFVILASRPFTTSTRRAAVAAVAAPVQYALLAAYFIGTGRLGLHASPLLSTTAAGTSILDEGARIMLLVIGGIITTYATSWNERTLHRVAEALRSSEGELRALMTAMSDVIMVLDREGRYLKIAPSGTHRLYRPPEQLIGRTLRDIFPGEQAKFFLDCIHRALQAGRPVEIEYTLPIGQETVWFAATVSRMSERAVVWVARDITERKGLEAQLTHQAFHDPLTGLANRALFRDRAEHALSRAARHRERVAVLFLDLDNFKTVNDSLGHGEGDRLLKGVAARLLNATRGCDTVARLGGDEFGVLLENVHEDADAAVVAERITSALRTAIPLRGKQVTIGASTGIARAADHDGAEELLRNADVAMYMAKSRGKGRWEIFAPAMHAAFVDRLALEGDLRRAVEQHDFRVWYQPIVELGSGAVVGVEALVRWQHAERGIVPPSAFIPLAEETGIIVPLGRWVLHEACRQGALWQAVRPNSVPFAVSINISGQQLQDNRFAVDVVEALRASGLRPSQLVLEITESVIMENTEMVLERLHELKRMGIRLAIDDFGTGYSSLSYLQRLPVDILKIDKAFIVGIAENGNDAALARTIVALGHMLSLRTVAEGIEEAHQQEMLRALGCELGQGYLFARPMPAAELTPLVAGEATPRPMGVSA